MLQWTAQVTSTSLRDNGSAPLNGQDEDANEASFFAALDELRQRGIVRPDTTRFDATPDGEKAISAVTLFELRFGAARAPHPAKIWQRIETRILSRCQVLPLRPDDALIAGDLLSMLVGGGYNITVQDILIAGTAKAAVHILVTRNVRHFDRIPELKLENWFEPPAAVAPQS